MPAFAMPPPASLLLSPNMSFLSLSFSCQRFRRFRENIDAFALDERLMPAHYFIFSPPEYENIAFRLSLHEHERHSHLRRQMFSPHHLSPYIEV